MPLNKQTKLLIHLFSPSSPFICLPYFLLYSSVSIFLLLCMSFSFLTFMQFLRLLKIFICCSHIYLVTSFFLIPFLFSLIHFFLSFLSFPIMSTLLSFFFHTSLIIDLPWQLSDWKYRSKTKGRLPFFSGFSQQMAPPAFTKLQTPSSLSEQFSIKRVIY